eukprot:8694982-Ditylum_brightwellii.AAC.1
MQMGEISEMIMAYVLVPLLELWMVKLNVEMKVSLVALWLESKRVATKGPEWVSLNVELETSNEQKMETEMDSFVSSGEPVGIDKEDRDRCSVGIED